MLAGADLNRVMMRKFDKVDPKKDFKANTGTPLYNIATPLYNIATPLYPPVLLHCCDIRRYELVKFPAVPHHNGIILN